jgi:hypothetical protein
MRRHGMSIKVKVVLLFVPLIVLLAVLSVVGSVNTGRLVRGITEVTERDIPLGTVVSRITESQLEQVIWVERALYAAERGDSSGVQMALTSFERLSATIDAELARGIGIARDSVEAAASERSRELFSAVERVLSGVARRRGVYEDRVRGFFDGGAESASSLSSPVLTDFQGEERDLYVELEDLRAELSSFTESATQDVLRSERVLMVLLIVSAAFALVIGLMVFPLLLLFWTREVG